MLEISLRLLGSEDGALCSKSESGIVSLSPGQEVPVPRCLVEPSQSRSRRPLSEAEEHDRALRGKTHEDPVGTGCLNKP